jgi:uncharacterized membrane protein YqjE
MASDADRSIATVLGDIADNIQHIVRAEVRLAQVELRTEFEKIRRGATLFAVAILAGVLGVGVLLLAAVYALQLVIAPWAAAGVVGLSTVAVAATCAAIGAKRFRQVTLPPSKTVESVKESYKWARTQTK